MENAGRVVKLCGCHGEPMYWHKRKNYSGGGLWRCSVRKAETDSAWQMRRYDSDPVFRITKRLRDNARGRNRTLQRMKEGTVGTLPHKG